MCFRYKYKLILYILLIASLGMLLFSLKLYSQKIPDKIFLKENDYNVLDLDIPFTGEFLTETSNNVKSVNFNYPVYIQTGSVGKYDIKLKLFGFIEYKNIEVNVKETEYLYACGNPIGIYLHSDGVLVVDNAEFVTKFGVKCSPCENIIRAGDYLISLNGIPISHKDSLIKMVEESNGEEIILTIRREATEINVKVKPEADSTGKYKIGLWVRDDTQGIGTLTYIDENGNFGALGHGISDSDVGEIIQISEGLLYKAKVLTVVKGEKGSPGEFVGTIDYSLNNQIGKITDNNECGIFGINATDDYCFETRKFPVGYKYEAKCGKAFIYSGTDENVNLYEIEINQLCPHTVDFNKGIEFTVTDEKLLSMTNGIVQGMFTSYNGSNNRKASKIKGFLMF